MIFWLLRLECGLNMNVCIFLENTIHHTRIHAHSAAEGIHSICTPLKS